MVAQFFKGYSSLQVTRLEGGNAAGGYVAGAYVAREVAADVTSFCWFYTSSPRGWKKISDVELLSCFQGFL
jgi:hypothetical protein